MIAGNDLKFLTANRKSSFEAFRDNAFPVIDAPARGKRNIAQKPLPFR
jgi:hypothetical protein